MIYIIEDNLRTIPRYFAINTYTLTGGLEWRDTPEEALYFFTSGIDIEKYHSVAEDLANNKPLDHYHRIYATYSPEEYPEFFI